jgi:phosphohistidine phosphatase SixA
LIALSGGGSIVAVGHQPDLSNFISMLVASAAYAAIAMAPCAIARVSLKVSPAGDHSEAHLHWLLTPDVIRKIAPGL